MSVKNLRFATETVLQLLIVSITAVVFFIEVHMPLGFTPWLLYVIPLGLTYWTSYRYAPLVLAALCTVLIVIGYFLSPDGVAAPIAVTNRTFGTVTVWFLSFLILRYKILADQLAQITKSLALELTDRTRDLGLAVSALQREMDRRNVAERDPLDSRTELAHHVTTILSTEGRRLQDKIAHYEGLKWPADEAEERLDTTRNELMQLGQRLERLQRELLGDSQTGS